MISALRTSSAAVCLAAFVCCRLFAEDSVVSYVIPEGTEPAQELAAAEQPASDSGPKLLCDGCAGQEACAVCCNPCCCCPCQPGWWFAADALFLRRSTAESQTLVRDQTTGDEILNTDNLTFDYQGLPSLQLMRRYCNCHGWDIRYFGLDSWSSSTDSGDPVSPAYEIPGFLLPSTQPGTIFRTNYGTDFYSAEINYRYWLNPCLSFVTGFRWLELGDELYVSQIAPVQNDLFTIDTNNHMYGWQVGADATVLNCGGRFHVDTVVRAAVLSNRADQRTVAPVLSGVGGFVDTLGASDNHTSFFGELGFRGVYWLTENMAVRGGYTLMWLEGVALAPEQIPVNSLIAPGTEAIDTSGGLFFDGATIGMLVRF